MTELEALIAESVARMTPEQFAAYDEALRATDFDALSPADQESFVFALRAANARRKAERPALDITVSRAGGVSIPPVVWGVGAVLAFLIITDFMRSSRS